MARPLAMVMTLPSWFPGPTGDNLRSWLLEPSHPLAFPASEFRAAVSTKSGRLCKSTISSESEVGIEKDVFYGDCAASHLFQKVTDK